MAKRSLVDQLNLAIEAMIARRDAAIPSGEPEVNELLRLATELRDLPAERFRENLHNDLQRRVIMTTKLKSTAERTRATAPYLSVRNAASAIEFYKRAFGATETTRLTEPGGRIGHAEILIGDGPVYLADEYPEYGIVGPQSLGGSGVTMHLYVDNVDEFVRRAVEAGATLQRPVSDEFYGDRSGKLVDPFGHSWMISTRKEDLSAEEMQKRFDDIMAQSSLPEEKVARPVKPIPKGFHTVTPYLCVKGAAELVDFVKDVFGATELLRTIGSAGGMHAEVKIGDSIIMIGGYPTMPEENPAAIYLYVDNVDELYERALNAGATSITPPQDQPYGDRNAGVKDPFGNVWYIAKHISDTHL